MRGGTTATRRQKFHTDDVNQCLYNKSGNHGVPNANLLNFTFLLVDFGQLLCSFANEFQQNSNASFREEYIPQALTVLLQIHRVYFVLPFVCHSKIMARTYNYSDGSSEVQSALMTRFRSDFASSVWNFCRCVTLYYLGAAITWEKFGEDGGLNKGRLIRSVGKVWTFHGPTYGK